MNHWFLKFLPRAAVLLVNESHLVIAGFKCYQVPRTSCSDTTTVGV